MTNIQTLIQNCFEIWTCRETRTARRAYHHAHCMVIPMTQDTFELPALANNAVFLEKTRDGMVDTVVLPLYCDRKSWYKTTASCIQNSINYSCRTPIQIPNPGAEGSPYYCACGAIFDKDFQPVLMVSWTMERVSVEDAKEEDWAFRFRFLQPILRVSPEVIINKSNPIERYIVNQIIPKTLSLSVVTPAYYSRSDVFVKDFSTRSRTPQVIIDKMPFEIKKVEAPSVSTTNKELLNVALSHIEEVIE